MRLYVKFMCIKIVFYWQCRCSEIIHGGLKGKAWGSNAIRQILIPLSDLAQKASGYDLYCTKAFITSHQSTACKWRSFNQTKLVAVMFWINPVMHSPVHLSVSNKTLTTSPTTMVLGGLTLCFSAKSAIVSMVPTTVRWFGHPALSTMATGVFVGYPAMLVRRWHNSRKRPTAMRNTIVCSLWYWMRSGDVPSRPYPVHITTWLDTPRCVTGMEPRRGAENAAETP